MFLIQHRHSPVLEDGEPPIEDAVWDSDHRMWSISEKFLDLEVLIELLSHNQKAIVEVFDNYTQIWYTDKCSFNQY